MLFEILSIINIAIILVLLRKILPLLRYLPTIKSIMTMWGRGTIQAKLDKIQTKEQVELVKSAKEKIATEIKSKVPFNIAENLTGDELFALMVDKEFVDFLKGLGFIAGVGLSAVQPILNRFGQVKEKSSGKAPMAT